MKIVAILASYNERSYVRASLESYFEQGIEVYLIDNDSTDGTFELAQEYLGKGLIGLERFPRAGVYEWGALLRRKEEVIEQINPDWAIHADIDEIRRGPDGMSLSEAIRQADAAGCNLINFVVYLFLPTLEAPDHESGRFADTMLTYRYLEPAYPNQMKGWKHRPGETVHLAATGGHKASVKDPQLWPRDCILRHYPVLSLDHATRKYVEKTYSAEEVAIGMHGWKAHVKTEQMRLPALAEMYMYESDATLRRDNPLRKTLMVQ